MDLASTLPYAAANWWLLSCGARVVAAVATLVQPRLRRWRATREDKPPVSIVIPVRRLEADAEAAFASAFSQDYPLVEVLVSAAEDASPALELAGRIARKFPLVRSRILNGNKQFTTNPKVSNLVPAIEAADHDLILVKDSNVRLQPDQLAEFVRYLTPGIGLVCSVPIGVAPIGFAAKIESAILNGNLAPVMFGFSLFRLNVGFSKVMLFERSNFYRAGGVRAIADTFGDDHALAKALARIGLRTIFVGSVTCQTLGRRSLREVCDRQLRWLMIRRFEAPLAYVVEPLFGSAVATIAGAIGAPLFGLPAWLMAAATLVFWLALQSLVVALNSWGWSWRFPIASLCGEIIMPVLWARSWFLRNARWAGRMFEMPRGIL
ncbi:MAG TPA: glycosyltransferase [Stellaceae bacterium]|nr:glycosyltransferase [Stellaceae bacterium]